MDTARIEPGALVSAADGRLGTVREVVLDPQTRQLDYLLVDREASELPVMIRAELIEAVPTPQTVQVRITRAEAGGGLNLGGGWAGADQTVSERTVDTSGAATIDRGADELRIPVLEERLAVTTRPVERGEVRVNVRVEQEEQTIQQPLMRDDVSIEHVPVNRVLDAPVTARHEGDWLVIPVMREELVVQKRLVLVEEVRIRARQVTEDQVVRETVRRTRVEVDDPTRPRPGGTLPGQTATESAEARAQRAATEPAAAEQSPSA